jgi:hypothetical protein
VRKAVAHACTPREVTGYIVFRQVMRPIQQLVYTDLMIQEAHDDTPQWSYPVRDKIQAVLGLAYHYHCKKTHAGIASSITPDIMAALAPVLGVAILIENAIAAYVSMETSGGILQPSSIVQRFRLSIEEAELWEAHRLARFHSEEIMRYRERRQAAPAAPWTTLAMQEAGGEITFGINGQQRENWTEQHRNTMLQDVPVPPVGFTVEGQDPEQLDLLHLQIYAEQLIGIIGQKRERRVMQEYYENLSIY